MFDTRSIDTSMWAHPSPCGPIAIPAASSTTTSDRRGRGVRASISGVTAATSVIRNNEWRLAASGISRLARIASQSPPADVEPSSSPARRAAVNSTRNTSPMMIRSMIICAMTTPRAGSVRGVMSPNPTVEKTVMVK